MTSAAGIAPERWIAAGVRHEVLLRTLPSLRHDMAAPVSVLRMATLLLKRQLAATPIDAAACLDRLAVLDRQLGALIDGIRLLRGWETGADAQLETVGRVLLVSKCVALLRPVFDLRGVSLVLDPALEAGSSTTASATTADTATAGEAQWPGASALRYLLLAALCYLHDTDPGIGVIQIVPADADALELRTQPRASDTRPLMAGLMLPEDRLEIDASALQCLANDLGYVVELRADAVRLCLASARLAAPAVPTLVG